MSSASWQNRVIGPLFRAAIRPLAFPLEPTPAKLRIGQAVSHWLERLLPYPPGARVLAVDYRQGADHPWPEAVDDAVSAYRYLLDAGHRHDNIVIAGESAGGHLTLSTVLALRDRGLPRPAGAIAMSPWTNLAGDFPAMDENRGRDVMLHTDAVRALGRFHARGRDPKSPEISPAFADFRDLPPLFILASDSEILRDDARAARDAALAAGVSVRYVEAPGLPHAWAAMPAVLPEARQAMEEMTGFIREVTSAAA